MEDEMTKGQLEAKISEIVSRFEIVYLGRGPKTIRSYIIGDMILVRMVSYLSQSEQKLATSERGVHLLKETKQHLFEEGRDLLQSMLKESFDIDIISTHMDISTKTGEKIVVLTLAEDLETKIKNNIPVSVF